MKKWFEENKRKIYDIKKNIWIPKDYSDYKDLNVDVISADTNSKLLTWRILREMTHTAV